MAFIPVTNVAQANIRHKLFDQDVENTTYWLNANPWTELELTDLVSAIISEWSTSIMPLLSADVSFEDVKVRDLTSAVGLGVELAVSPIVIGGVGSPSLPGNVAFCVKKTTGYTGRVARGRLYLAGVAESIATGNEVTPAWRTNVLVGLTNFQTGVESVLTGVTHVHVSRYFNGNPRITGAYWNVVSFTADTILDSQRRRLTGRGR